MEARALLGLLFLVIYVIIGLLIAVYSRRFLRPGEADFYIASGRLGGLVSALTYAATTYSGFMMVGLVGLAYATGVGAHAFELAYYIATLAILTYFAPRVWERARARGWVSPAEMLSDHYGSRLVGALVALLYLVSLIPYTSIQIISVGLVLSQMMGGEGYYVVGVVLAATLIVVWSLIAGMWSVALTDAFQGLVMLVGALLYIAWLSSLVVGGIGLEGVTRKLSEAGLLGMSSFWSLHVFLAFTIPWVFFAIIHPQVVQRLYVPRDRGSLATMVKGFAVFGLLYTVIATMLGLLARAGAESGILPYVDPAKRDLVTPTLLAMANPLLSAIVSTNIIVAAITTADSIILSLASSVSRDLAYRLGERLRLLVGYASVTLFTLIALIVAYLRLGFIVDLAVLTSLMLLPLAPVTIACWLNIKASWWAALASITLSFIPVLHAVYENIGKPSQALFYQYLGIPIPVVVLAIATLVLAVGVVSNMLKQPSRPSLDYHQSK